jgi:hypothetical protein
MRSYAYEFFGMVKEYVIHLFVLMGFGLWEYWLGKTKKVAANSTIELFSWLIKKKEIKMEDKSLVHESLGEVGALDLVIKDDKLSLEVAVAKGPASASMKLELDAIPLVVAALQYCKEKIPGTIDDVVIDAAVAMILKLKK